MARTVELIIFELSTWKHAGTKLALETMSPFRDFEMVI
jgi:hypothetical protein